MPIKSFLVKVLLSCAVVCGLVGIANAGPETPDTTVANSQQASLLASVDWTQNLGNKVPLDLTFVDDQGKAVKLGDYFGSRPVILTLMYFECPMLCGEVINGTFQGMQDLKFKAGHDFEYVAVSINPEEGPKLAAEQKASYLKRYKMTEFAEGYHFLTGKQQNIQALAKAVGFHYSYDPHTKSYAHPAGIILVNPDGRISHYMGGVVFHTQDLRLGLVDASQGKVGSLADMILLKCCSFDPNTGKYNLAVHNLLRGGGILILLILGSLIFALTRPKNNKDGSEAVPGE
jgi:protein SCO1/2